MNRRTAVALALLAIVALMGALSGCKKPPENEPGAIAQAFADALAEGDTKTASELWNYVVEARQQSAIWDDIAPGRQAQIIRELQEDKATEFTQWTSYFGEEMTAGTPATQGSISSVVVAGGPQGDVTIYLAESDGQWGVTGCQP